jgi:hypothetical protein
MQPKCVEGKFAAAMPTVKENLKAIAEFPS